MRWMYCTDCGWSIDESDSYSQEERNRAAIEHHIATGHAIESVTVSTSKR